MSPYIQQQFSGKIMRVLHDTPGWLVLRPVPDDDGPDITISREHFDFKWRYYTGEIPSEPQKLRQFVFGEKVEDGTPQVEKRKRGRPAGSKNKQPTAV